MTETDYNDIDLELAHNEHIIYEEEDSPKYSAVLIRQYKRAKRASVKNDLRSKKIVKALTKERKKMNKQTTPKTVMKRVAKHRQKTVFDFGGNR